MALLMMLVVAALATVALAAPQPTAPVGKNYIFIFNDVSSSNPAAVSAFEINKAHALNQVANKSASPSDVKMLFSIGDMSGFVAYGLKDEDLKQLQSKLSTIGKFVPDTKLNFKLPRPNRNVTYTPPQVHTTATCAAKCCKRSVSTANNLNLDMLDASMNKVYCAPVDGTQKMTVFTLDTGVDAGHPYFKGRAVSFGDCKQTGLDPWTVNVDADGHGTHVAGIIGSDYYGVTTNVVINVIKVINDEGSGTASSVICGINRVKLWLTSNPTAKAVLSISLGFNSIDSTSDTALNALATTYASRLVVVVAAGNSGDNACSYTFSRGTNVIAVGAVDSILAETYYSNYGSCVDILAPGDNILSTYPRSLGSTTFLSGTSMAAPLVSGTIAQYWLNNPTLLGTAIRANINAASNTLFNNQITCRNPATPNKLVQYICASCV